MPSNESGMLFLYIRVWDKTIWSRWEHGAKELEKKKSMVDKEQIRERVWYRVWEKHVNMIREE